jgi:predicted transcriptional regulator
MSRPPIRKQVEMKVRVDVSTRDQLQVIGKELERPMNWIAKQAILWYIQEYQKEKEEERKRIADA